MELRVGDIWKYEKEADLIVITTNSYVKHNGELVMGRGFAYEAKRRYPELPKLFGRKVQEIGSRYGFVVVGTRGKLFGAFQVKYHFKYPASLELIRFSTEKLKTYAERKPEMTIFLNFPGIGNGKLRDEEKEIADIISVLPDNVVVWKRGRVGSKSTFLNYPFGGDFNLAVTFAKLILKQVER